MKIFERSWLWRRWGVFSQLAVLDASLLFIVWRNVDTVLYRDVATAILIAIPAILAQYILGAVWDDKNKDGAVSPPPPAEPVTVISEKTTVTGAPVTNTAAEEPAPPKGFAE